MNSKRTSHDKRIVLTGKFSGRNCSMWLVDDNEISNITKGAKKKSIRVRPNNNKQIDSRENSKLDRYLLILGVFIAFVELLVTLLL